MLGHPQGVAGVGAGLCTSVTASRMTHAYGASTLWVPLTDEFPLVYDYSNAQMRHPRAWEVLEATCIRYVSLSEVVIESYLAFSLPY